MYCIIQICARRYGTITFFRQKKLNITIKSYVSIIKSVNTYITTYIVCLMKQSARAESKSKRSHKIQQDLTSSTSAEPF